jgi:hypothetical protein
MMAATMATTTKASKAMPMANKNKATSTIMTTTVIMATTLPIFQAAE